VPIISGLRSLRATGIWSRAGGSDFLPDSLTPKIRKMVNFARDFAENDARVVNEQSCSKALYKAEIPPFRQKNAIKRKTDGRTDSRNQQQDSGNDYQGHLPDRDQDGDQQRGRNEGQVSLERHLNDNRLEQDRRDL